MDSIFTPVFPSDLAVSALPAASSSASPPTNAMFEDTTPGEHHIGQPWAPAPSNLQEQGQQTSTNLPLIAAILGIIIVVSIVLGLVGWACKLHRRKMRWNKEDGRERDVEKADAREGAECAQVERRDSEMTAVGDDDEVDRREKEGVTKEGDGVKQVDQAKVA